MLSASGPVPNSAEGLLHSGRLTREDDPSVRGGAQVLHTTSPFFGLPASYRPLDAPYGASVVTLYDLIPLRYPKHYLPTSTARAQYQARLDRARHADAIVSISQATTRDAIAMLGVDPRRVITIGAGVSDAFVPSLDRQKTLMEAQQSLPALRAGFLLYTGGIDFRKNLDGLFAAFAQLPRAFRREHQLVVVCQLRPSEREHLVVLARSLGIEHDVLLTGYVEDHVLIQLYQTTHLLVFPSYYEGFGLPVAEALACGAPCIVGDNSSLADIVTDPVARFDPSDADDIARCIMQATRPGALRDSLFELARSSRYSWDDVAAATLEAYDDVARSRAHPRGGRERPRIALVGPMPPLASGVADYSARLLPHLADHVDVDVFCQANATRQQLPGVRWFHYSAFSSVRHAEYGFDDVIYCVGNSEYHYDVFALMRRWLGGTALMHDVNLQAVMRVARRARPDIVDPRDVEVLHSIDAGTMPSVHAGYPAHHTSRYFDMNHPLVHSIARSVDRVLVHSRYAGAVARLDIDAHEREKVSEVTFGHRPAIARTPSAKRDAVVSMGIAASTKQSATVIEAFIDVAVSHPSTVFAVVGENHLDDVTMSRLIDLARAKGVDDRVIVTGRVDEAEYESWLARAQLAVQLRSVSRGETSAAIADCLTHGVPVIVSDLGSARELPDEVAYSIDVRADAHEVADRVSELLNDPARLSAMSAAGQRMADERSFASAAADIVGRHARLLR